MRKAWTLLQSNHLFTNTPHLLTQVDHARRFAEMIALLGHPPVEVLGRSGGEESWRFWDRDGMLFVFYLSLVSIYI